MAMARSSLKGMWNFSCEGGTYLYTQGKMGASFMFQTWKRGLICLLVLASLPLLAPMIIVSMMVGGVFLVPLLCGVALIRPASMSNIIKRFRSSKPVLRSGSAELVMEDLDVHDGGNRDHGASFGIFNLDRKDVADSSDAGIAAEEDSALGVPSEKELAVDEEIMEDKDVVLHGRGGRAQEEENRLSESLLSQELVEAKSPFEESGEHCADDSYPVAENQDLESKEAEYNAFHFDDQEREPSEDQSMTLEPSDKDPLEDEFPILDITASGIILEELNLPADKEEPSHVQDVVDNQQEQLEEPEHLKEGLREGAPEEGLPDDPTALHVVSEDEAPIVQEKGIEIPLVVSESVSEEKGVPEIEEEDVAAISLESEVSMMEQYSLPVESGSLKFYSSIEDVPAIGEAAPVPEAVSASVEEYGAKDAEVPEAPNGEEKEKAGLVLEYSASIMDQQSLPVYSEPVELASSVMDIPTLAEAAPVQEADPLLQEFDAKEAEVPEAPMVKENEVEASAEDPGISEPDTLVVEPDVAREVVSESAAPEVVAEEKVQFVQDKEVASELVSEESKLPVVEEKGVPASSLESEVSMMDQYSLAVVSEPVDLVSPVADVPDIEEPAFMEQAVPVEVYASAEEALAGKVEDPETSVMEDKEMKAPVATLEEMKVEEQPVVLAPAQEGAAPETEAPIAEPELTEEVKAKPAASEAVEEVGDVDLPSVVSEPVTEEQEILVVAEDVEAAPTLASEPLVVEEKSLLEEEAAPVGDAALAREGLLRKGEESEAPVVDVKEINAPLAALQETLAEEGATPEVEAPIAEVEVIKEAQAGPAASEVFAEEAQDKVELSPPVSKPVSEEKEAPGVEESLAVPKLELEAPVVAGKSLSVQEVQVEAAPVEETYVNKVGEPESSTVGKTEGADDTTLHVSSKVDSGTSSEATVVETISPLYKDIIDGVESQEHGSEDITISEAHAKFGKGEGHDRISSDLDPPLDLEDSTAADENLDQASKDRILNLEVEDAPLISASSSAAQLVERGNEADEDVQKLEENLEKDKVVESHIEQDVFPTLKPLNVVQSKDTSHDEQAEECDSISTRAPVQRRISFENVRADEEVNTGAPLLPSHMTDVGTGVQGTNFVFKSRLGRDHRTHRHSAPDFLGTQTWVREAPLYSPQDSFRGHKNARYKKWPEFEGARSARTFSASGSDSGETHMGEFESLLQSWQERDKATQSPTASPSGSPRSPAEIGRQIREEISTIQKIIGQEIPPQYSLWKEVETLCQIVGMELPYMGDVSDLTKARHGLDLLKVVVGIKWT